MGLEDVLIAGIEGATIAAEAWSEAQVMAHQAQTEREKNFWNRQAQVAGLALQKIEQELRHEEVMGQQALTERVEGRRLESEERQLGMELGTKQELAKLNEQLQRFTAQLESRTKLDVTDKITDRETSLAEEQTERDVALQEMRNESKSEEIQGYITQEKIRASSNKQIQRWRNATEEEKERIRAEAMKYQSDRISEDKKYQADTQRFLSEMDNRTRVTQSAMKTARMARYGGLGFEDQDLWKNLLSPWEDWMDSNIDFGNAGHALPQELVKAEMAAKRMMTTVWNQGGVTPGQLRVFSDLVATTLAKQDPEKPGTWHINQEIIDHAKTLLKAGRSVNTESDHPGLNVPEGFGGSTVEEHWRSFLQESQEAGEIDKVRLGILYSQLGEPPEDIGNALADIEEGVEE